MVATRVHQGMFQVVEVTPKPRGHDDVTPISPWLPIPEEFKKLAEDDGLLGNSYMLVKGTQYESLFEANESLLNFHPTLAELLARRKVGGEQ